MKRKIFFNICIFIIISLCSFMIEHTLLKSKKKCNKTNEVLSNIVSFIHNIGSMYITFGSLLFGHYVLHFIALILILLSWYISNKIDNKKVSCIITQIYNRLCGFDEGRHFHDLNYYIFNRILGIQNYSIGLYLCIVLYDLYHLYFIFF